MKPEEIIKYLEMVRPTENYSHTFSVSVGNARHFGPGSQLNKDVSKAIDLAIEALEKQKINERSKLLKWHKCTRKNGTEFLKLIYYSPYLDGYVELGRFNMTKFEAQNNEWTLTEIMKELE